MTRPPTHEPPRAEPFPHCDDRVRACVEQAEESWQECDGTRRLWEADATLWTGADEDSWLGWLDTAAASQTQLAEWQTWASAVREDGIEDIVVLGMGGSSLCPEVLAQTFGTQPGYPRLRVLDSTVPAQVEALGDAIDLAHSLFVVSSKSGTTIEADVLLAHFYARVQGTLGSSREVGRHFVAITDEGTPLEALASKRGFRHVARGVATIGGRFSALSPFGMLPAALAGMKVDEFLSRAQLMTDACRAGPGVDSNPGARLGVAMAGLFRAGRDKLSLITSPGLAALGTWLDQLVAESTGKGDLGIVPVADEPLRTADRYGDDRFFVYVRLAGDACPEQDASVAALERAGLPTITLEVADVLELPAEFFRWEFAIAVAGSLLGLNPFHQPDVEAAKVAARELTDGFARSGALPAAVPDAVADGVSLYADARFSDARFSSAVAPDLVTSLAAHFARVSPGDYFALNAFVDMNPRNRASLSRIADAVGAVCGAATTLGFGPRFLHSTGQLHKGGPNTGVFLQLTADDASDLEIPGRDYSFGVLKQAQALGDFRVLCERGRRVLRLHVGSQVEEELERIAAAAQRAAQQLGEETT